MKDFLTRLNIKTYLPLLVIFFVVGACKKNDKIAPVTQPVDFTGTTYTTLGSFDSFGTPDYLLPKDSISADVQSYIDATLIEKADLRTTHPELLANTAIADIEITTPSDVFIIFVSQLTNSKNALAFYTYPTNSPPATAKDIQTITYIFPSIGLGTKLQSGDKVKIGRFEVGTSIGLVLLKDAWNSATRTLDNTAVHFCSNDVLNPEIARNLKKHAVLFNNPFDNKLLVGFENTNRTIATCDNDFNDVVIYATVTP